MNVSEFIFRILGPILLLSALVCWQPSSDSVQDLQRLVKRDLLSNGTTYTQGSNEDSSTDEGFSKVSGSEVRAVLLTPSDKQIVVELEDNEHTVITARKTATGKWKITTSVGVYNTQKTETHVYEEGEYPNEIDFVGIASTYSVSVVEEVVTYRKCEN